MYRWFLLLLSLSFAAPAPAGEPPVVLVVGDSLSTSYGLARDEGWVALLERRLAEEALPCRVVNASITGDTSSSGAARLPRALRRHQPATVILGLGGNDGLRGYPPADLRANLATMIGDAQRAGADVLLLSVSIPPNYGPDYRRAFGEVYAGLAAEFDVPVVHFAIEDVADRAGMLQDDGIHPTAAAQPWMLDRVWAELHAMLKCTV